ncbi:titin-like [Stegodyphus dumicola]|uniref:titin-like n=1 Tax=Stegodyphus dumicola TaxID=202533 RepID=UPI0015A90013|nr:titin-like [Stegodyphus dumicola]
MDVRKMYIWSEGQQTECIVNGLQTSHIYQFRVYAKNEAGRSEGLLNKTLVRVKAMSKKPPRPSPPTIEIVDDDSVLLRWAVPSGFEKLNYIVERFEPKSDLWLQCNRKVITDNEFLVSGLHADKEYKFRISSENEQGLSLPSEESELVFLKGSEGEAPSVILHLTDTCISEGEDAFLHCKYTGTSPIQVTWWKDNIRVREGFSVMEGESTLKLQGIDDDYSIRCELRNEWGKASTEAKIQIMTAPKITIPVSYKEGLTYETGDTLRLKVSYSGTPTPTISWLLNEKIREADERCYVSLLHDVIQIQIREICGKDAGHYTFVASNKIGEDTVVVPVIVLGPPDPPAGQPVLELLEGSQATLSWKPPSRDGGSSLFSYIIEKRMLESDEWIQLFTTHRTTITLEGVKDVEECLFRVRTSNIYGISAPSQPSQFFNSRGLLTLCSEEITQSDSMCDKTFNAVCNNETQNIFAESTMLTKNDNALENKSHTEVPSEASELTKNQREADSHSFLTTVEYNQDLQSYDDQKPTFIIPFGACIESHNVFSEHSSSVDDELLNIERTGVIYNKSESHNFYNIQSTAETLDLAKKYKCYSNTTVDNPSGMVEDDPEVSEILIHIPSYSQSGICIDHTDDLKMHEPKCSYTAEEPECSHTEEQGYDIVTKTSYNNDLQQLNCTRVNVGNIYYPYVGILQLDFQSSLVLFYQKNLNVVHLFSFDKNGTILSYTNVSWQETDPPFNPGLRPENLFNLLNTFCIPEIINKALKAIMPLSLEKAEKDEATSSKTDFASKQSTSWSEKERDTKFSQLDSCSSFGKNVSLYTKFQKKRSINILDEADDEEDNEDSSFICSLKKEDESFLEGDYIGSISSELNNEEIIDQIRAEELTEVNADDWVYQVSPFSIPIEETAFEENADDVLYSEFKVQEIENDKFNLQEKSVKELLNFTEEVERRFAEKAHQIESLENILQEQLSHLEQDLKAVHEMHENLINNNTIPTSEGFLEEDVEKDGINDENSIKFNLKEQYVEGYNITYEDQTEFESDFLSPNQSETGKEEYAPRVLVHLQNRIVQTGYRTRFYCLISSNPDPHVMWMKNEKPLPQSSRLIIGSLVDSGQYLDIYNAKTSDSGQYACVASNCHGSAQTQSYLQVMGVREFSPEPPNFLKSPQDISVSSGNTVTLEWKISGTPIPNVLWYKNAEKISATLRIDTFSNHRGICRLILRSVTVEDSAIYTCYLENEAGSSLSTVFVSVTDASTDRDSKSGYNFSQDETEMKQTNYRIDSEVMEIEDEDPKHAVGKSTEATGTTIVPAAASVLSTGRTWVILSWSAPTDQQAPKGSTRKPVYLVQRRLSNSNHWKEVGRTRNTLYTVQGLTSGQSYVFQISSCNNGIWSASITLPQPLDVRNKR